MAGTEPGGRGKRLGLISLTDFNKTASSCPLFCDVTECNISRYGRCIAFRRITIPDAARGENNYRLTGMHRRWLNFPGNVSSFPLRWSRVSLTTSGSLPANPTAGIECGRCCGCQKFLSTPATRWERMKNGRTSSITASFRPPHLPTADIS